MQEELLKLFSDYLEDVEYLSNEEKDMMMRLGVESKKNLTFWYLCFESINHSRQKVEMQELQLTFEIKERCGITWNNKKLEIEEDEAKELIEHFIDIFEDIYPLGTVVELNAAFSKSLNLRKATHPIRVVIVDRFISTRDKTAYFPYAGVVYPVGTFGYGKCVQFTSALIDSVVHAGYRDEMDEAYIVLMKKELILDNEAVSFGFVEQSQMDEYRAMIGEIYSGEEGN